MKNHKSSQATQPDPSLEQIQIRAYELYEEGGRQCGHEVEDWLRAEQELRERPASRKMRDLEDRVA